MSKILFLGMFLVFATLNYHSYGADSIQLDQSFQRDIYPGISKTCVFHNTLNLGNSSTCLKTLGFHNIVRRPLGICHPCCKNNLSNFGHQKNIKGFPTHPYARSPRDFFMVD